MNEHKEKKGLSPGWIALIVILVLIILISAGVLGYWLMSKNQFEARVRADYLTAQQNQ